MMERACDTQIAQPLGDLAGQLRSHGKSLHPHERIALGLALNRYHRSTLFGSEARGYTDFPTCEALVTYEARLNDPGQRVLAWSLAARTLLCLESFNGRIERREDPCTTKRSSNARKL